MRISLLFITLLLLITAGCAHVISDENLKGVNTSIRFEKLKDNPVAYAAANVLLGGIIAKTVNSAEGGQVEIIQFDLTEDGYPIEEKGSAGRFLATSPVHLDTDIYQEGKLITVAGEVKGARSIKTADAVTTYPVISIRESHVWQPEDKHELPFRIPGTNLVDPYYHGIDAPQPNRYNGTSIPPLVSP